MVPYRHLAPDMLGIHVLAMPHARTEQPVQACLGDEGLDMAHSSPQTASKSR